MFRRFLGPAGALLLALLSVLPYPKLVMAAAGPTKNVFHDRYVLVFANLARQDGLQKLLGIMNRAAASGYNGIVLGTTAGQYIDIWNRAPSAAYTAAFATAREHAAALHLALIPYAINPNEVGYAAPELSEAIPCRDTEFVVQGASARAVSSELLVNPGFESARGNEPDEWGIDKPSIITFIDPAEKHGGKSSIRIQDPGKGNPQHGYGRLWQTVKVTPFRAYQFSVWIKTRALSNTSNVQFYFEGLDGGQPLVYANRDEALGQGLASTQDWKKYSVLLNSASNTRLELFFGIWDNHATGSLWFDDASLHEVGLADSVRRESLPLTVTSFDGATTYKEGPDYAVSDRALIIPPGSAIPDGARLKVSWWQRATMIGPPFANASHPHYFEVERSIAGKLDSLFGHPAAFMMTFDEWRVANWDPAAGPITAGEYMARTVRKSAEMLHQINPAYELYTWSDMFDPNENAVDKYFLCNGPVTGSWKGLPAGLVIVTWTGGSKALQFFSNLKMRQIIGGYYSDLNNVKQWLDELDQVEAQGATGIDGFLYTTWDNHYEDIEKVADMIKARGRWGSGPAVMAGRQP